MESDQAPRPDDALHPVRRLRRERSGRRASRAGAGARPARAPSAAVSSGVETPVKRRSRLPLAIGLALVLAVSGAWSALASTAAAGCTHTRDEGIRPIPAQTPPTPSEICACSAAPPGGSAHRRRGGPPYHPGGAALERCLTAHAGDGHRRFVRRRRDGAGADRPCQRQRADHDPVVVDQRRGRHLEPAGSFAVLGFSPGLVGRSTSWILSMAGSPSSRTTPGHRHRALQHRGWRRPLEPDRRRRTTGPATLGRRDRPGRLRPAHRSLHQRHHRLADRDLLERPATPYVSHDGGSAGRTSRSRPSREALGEKSSPPTFTSAEDAPCSPRIRGVAVSVGLFATTDGGQTCRSATPVRGRRSAATSWTRTTAGCPCSLPTAPPRRSRPLCHRRRGSTWSMLSAFPYVGWTSTSSPLDGVGFHRSNQFGEGAATLWRQTTGPQLKALSPRLSPLPAS